MTHDEFIEKANAIHKHKYDYTNTKLRVLTITLMLFVQNMVSGVCFDKSSKWLWMSCMRC